MFNSAMFNESPFNGTATIEQARTYSPDQPYVLHLRDDSGVFLGKVTGWTSGKWDDKVNAPGVLKIQMPLDATMVQDNLFVNPNRIWVHDNTIRLVKQFVIVKTTANVVNGTYDIECAGLMYLLAQDYAPIRDAVEQISLVGDRLRELLDYQISDNPITMGYVNPGIYNLPHTTGVSTDKSIMGAIIGMWKQVGGVMSIDPEGRFSWDVDSAGTAKYVLSLNEDIESYSYVVDTDNIINRVHAFGNIQDNGTTHERPQLPGPFYVEDTDSQAIYGIRRQRFSFNIESDSELLGYANKILAKFKDPVIKRNIGAIDLARAQFDPDDPVTPHPEYIFAGAKIKINPPGNIPGDGLFNTLILSVSRDLADPLAVKIHVGEIDTSSAKAKKTSNDGSEFFDIIADAFEDADEALEISHEQDEDLWAFVDTLTTPSDDDDDIQPVGASNEAGGAINQAAFIDHEHDGIIKVWDATNEEVADLGTPDGIAMGWLDDGAGVNEGAYIFPADGSSNDDWKKVLSVIFDDTWTEKSELGIPNGSAFGYIAAGEDDSGWWIFPPDGTTNDDWLPLPAYN